MSLNPRKINKRRETITALPLYYSGYLLKKCKKQKDFKKFYGELRGATLFLYEDNTQATYTEKLNLEELKSMDLDSPYQKKTPTIFTLKLPKEEVHLKMDNPDNGEEWRGYILTVIKKEIPSDLQLLPGQMIQLREVLTQETTRNGLGQFPPVPPRPSFLHTDSSFSRLSRDEPDNTDFPECFFDVTREEAKKMLEENPEFGSMILRPSTLANNYALTIRQMMSSGPLIKNYRVSATSSGFVIELESAVSVSSLYEVIDYFMKMTENRLRPYNASEPYDICIEASQAPRNISLPPPPPKILPKALVSPIQRPKPTERPPPPPPPIPEPMDSEYVVPIDKPDDHELKAKLGGELKEALKLRRLDLYTESGEEESPDYENKSSKKYATTFSY